MNTPDQIEKNARIAAGLPVVTPEEHLSLILVHCRDCLAIAEKRTPGRWQTSPSQEAVWNVHRLTVADLPLTCLFPGTSDHKANATFISTCAGSAEAGWRATIAAIEGLRKRKFEEESYPQSTAGIYRLAQIDAETRAILSAYPLTLLQ